MNSPAALSLPKALCIWNPLRFSMAFPPGDMAIADALLELQIFMAQGANTSYLRLELIRSTAPMRVSLIPYVSYRDFHSQSHGAQPFELESAADQCRIQASPGARPYRLLVTAGKFTPAPEWYWNFWHREEAQRGLDASEDLFFPGSFSADLEVRVPMYFIATAETAAPAAGGEVAKSIQDDGKILAARLPRNAPAWIRTLARASDQFIVRRGDTGAAAASIIAGYPWFADWGRDTMISLPGLATV